MTASRPNNEAIFHAARDIPDPDRRREYVREACGGDETRIAHVEALLAAADAPDSLLDRPAGSDPVATTDQPTPESPGTVIGPYKLIEQIGEGGMGTVWMAQQTEPIKRLVAVKLIKAGMDSKQVIARFEAERQALALMDHANIARVLDAGTTGAGRPYFVMDLVKGVPITRYCDEHRLTPRQRLELFVPVCQAVQHAHQKGIIHRDLKPSNVLVALYDGEPVPKVIDFGVAKAAGQSLTDKTLVTGFGNIVGTLEYMSPEQAEINQLDIDTRSDIYSLGVLLYELLAGSPPFSRKELAKGGMLEMLRLIREQQPAKPSTKLSTAEGLPALAANRGTEPGKLTKLIRGELDWIVMKALEKERNRRYETANGFAMDVQRYLADEPVVAGPPSAWYRLRKFARRNKGWVLAAAGFAAFVVLGIAGLIVAFVVVNAERQRTADALAAETKARKQTREALNTMTDDVIETLFAKQPQLGDNQKAFLRKVLGFYQVFAAEQGETEEARAVAADGQFRVAKVRAFLGETTEAVTGYHEAIRLLKKLAAEFPTVPAYRQNLARSHNNLGNRLMEQGKRPEAESAFRQALVIFEKLDAEFPSVPEYRQDLARSHNSLGILLRELGRPAEAATAIRQALVIQEKLVAKFPTAPACRDELATSYTSLAVLLPELDKRPEAESAFRKALAIFEKLDAEFPSVPEYRQDLARSYNNLGKLLHELGKGPEAEAEAETAFRQALAIFEKLDAEFPSVRAYRQELAVSHNNLGALLSDRGNLPEAEMAYRQALAIREKLAADFSNVPEYRTDLGESCLNFGNLLCGQQRAQDALEWYAKAIALLEANLAQDVRLAKERRFLRTAHRNRAIASTDLKRYAEALKDWNRAIKLAEEPDQPELRLGRAVTLARTGDHAQAVNAADDLTRNDKTPGGTLYDAACVYGVALTAVKEDMSLKEQYAKKAVTLLRRAQAAGFFKDAQAVEHLQKDDDLAALREREDFEKLLKELEEKLKQPARAPTSLPGLGSCLATMDAATKTLHSITQPPTIGVFSHDIPFPVAYQRTDQDRSCRIPELPRFPVPDCSITAVGGGAGRPHGA